MKTFLLLFLAGSLSAQLYPVKRKGDVFNKVPMQPMENIDNTGFVTVKRSLYGLYFEDKNLSDETKTRIEKFFRQQNKGYTDFKTYHLKIRRKNNDWFIEHYKF